MTFDEAINQIKISPNIFVTDAMAIMVIKSVKERNDTLEHYLAKWQELEEKLGFKLTELEEVSENSFYVTDSKDIHFNGDDFYGDYTPEELKQVIKNILGEYLRCMREVKQ